MGTDISGVSIKAVGVALSIPPNKTSHYTNTKYAAESAHRNDPFPK